MFVLDVQKVKIQLVSRELTTSGSVGIYDCKFVFDSIWDELAKTAVFRVGQGKIYEVLLDDSNTCKIPWEVFSECSPGKALMIGVYGVNDDTIVVPTIWCNVGYIAQGVKYGEASAEPTPDVYQQLVSAIATLKDHSKLTHRDDPDQHPIESISGLDEVTNTDIFNLWNGVGLDG